MASDDLLPAAMLSIGALCGLFYLLSWVRECAAEANPLSPRPGAEPRQSLCLCTRLLVILLVFVASIVTFGLWSTLAIRGLDPDLEPPFDFARMPERCNVTNVTHTALDAWAEGYPYPMRTCIDVFSLEFVFDGVPLAAEDRRFQRRAADTARETMRLQQETDRRLQPALPEPMDDEACTPKRAASPAFSSVPAIGQLVDCWRPRPGRAAFVNSSAQLYHCPNVPCIKLLDPQADAPENSYHRLVLGLFAVGAVCICMVFGVLMMNDEFARQRAIGERQWQVAPLV